MRNFLWNGVREASDPASKESVTTSKNQAYREGVGMAPTESVASAAEAAIPALPGAVGRALLEELWRECDAAGWGLAEDEFERILLEAGTAQNFGLADGA